MEKVLFVEDFSKGMDDWWAEGGQKVWVEAGRLHVKADPTKGERGYGVATVWCKKQFPGDLRVEFDTHVIDSSKDVNNINFFICYSDPSGKPLYETRQSRATGKYGLYHKLNGHIFTYLKDIGKAGGIHPDGSTKGRFRIRHCPGFKLLDESYDYHCEKGRTYHVTLTKRGGTLSIGVDGKTYCTAEDPDPRGAGLIGCRTYCTYLWWDNIKVTQLPPQPAPAK